MPRPDRLNLTDWRIVNEALALLEADVSAEEPDEYAPEDEYAHWQKRYDRIGETRTKVHQRARADEQEEV